MIASEPLTNSSRGERVWLQDCPERNRAVPVETLAGGHALFSGLQSACTSIVLLTPHWVPLLQYRTASCSSNTALCPVPPTPHCVPFLQHRTVSRSSNTALCPVPPTPHCVPFLQHRTVSRSSNTPPCSAAAHAATALLLKERFGYIANLVQLV